MDKPCVWPWPGRIQRARCRFGLARVLTNYLLSPIAILAVFTSAANADIGIESPPIYNLYGQVGLLDMPSARLAADGEVSFTFAADKTDEHYNLDFQALPWLETTFRYSRIDRYLISTPGSQGDLYDRSFGVKIRLSQEGEIWPSIVIGAQDILGTGAYSGEYLAASKRFGDLDFTLGLGWQRLAGLETFPNPFALIFPSFKYANTASSQGLPLTGQLFRGPDMGLFGGVTWETPIDGLSLIAELSGDSYTREQQAGSIDVRSHVNMGLSYEPLTGLEIGGGYLYGSEWGIRITLNMNAFDPPPAPKLGPQPLDPVVRTSQERADATENLLESMTHFYDVPAQIDPTAPRSVSVEDFVDQIFNSAEQNQFSVKDAEVFHGSMIFEVSGGSTNFSCTNLTGSHAAATMSGLKQFVVTFSNSSETKFCDAIRPRQKNFQGQRYASIDNLAIADSDGDNINTETAKTNEPASDPKFDPTAIKKKLADDARSQNLLIFAIKIEPSRIEVAFLNGTYRSNDEAMGRLLRVLMADAPSSVEEFKLVNTAGNLPTVAVTLSRSDIERTLNAFGSASELLSVSNMTTVEENDPLLVGYADKNYPEFSYSVAPGLNKSLFDPDEPFRFGAYIALNGDVGIDRHLSIDGTFDVNVYNTFGSITRSPDSALPHVRTAFAEYFKKGINGISNLQASYVTKLAADVYALARAGYLEDMFGGVGGEVLWEPEDARWALGGALYEVQQRNFDRLFGFQPYHVLTGHVSLYYQSPFYGLDFQLHVGRYLAGDYGATFEMTRRFDNGIEIGAYATLTNVPFSVFGEGSFDKGFIIHIPLDNLLPVNTQGTFAFDFSPLTRDGGQRLVGEQTLYGYIQTASEGDLRANWDEVLRP